jgi:hypothetical protein
MKTITPVKIVADLLTVCGDKYDALLYLTIDIDNGVLTIGSLGGPDMWRANLKDLGHDGER